MKSIVMYSDLGGMTDRGYTAMPYDGATAGDPSKGVYVYSSACMYVQQGHYDRGRIRS